MAKKGEKRRKEILWAAFRVFSERGYHNSKISDIAEVLQIGHGTFYRYFQNKLDIFTHVIDVVIEQITKMIGIEDPESTNTLEEYHAQVERIGHRLFDLLVADQRLGRLLFEEAPGIDSAVSRKIQDSWHLFGQYTERYLINGCDKGFLRKDLNTRITALAINSMIFEGGRQALHADDPTVQKEEWIQAITQMIFSGIQHQKNHLT